MSQLPEAFNSESLTKHQHTAIPDTKLIAKNKPSRHTVMQNHGLIGPQPERVRYDTNRWSTLL